VKWSRTMSLQSLFQIIIHGQLVLSVGFYSMINISRLAQQFMLIVSKSWPETDKYYSKFKAKKNPRLETWHVGWESINHIHIIGCRKIPTELCHKLYLKLIESIMHRQCIQWFVLTFWVTILTSIHVDLVHLYVRWCGMVSKFSFVRGWRVLTKHCEKWPSDVENWWLHHFIWTDWSSFRPPQRYQNHSGCDWLTPGLNKARLHNIIHTSTITFTVFCTSYILH